MEERRKAVTYNDVFSQIAESFELGFEKGIGRRDEYYEKGFEDGVRIGQQIKKKVCKDWEFH